MKRMLAAAAALLLVGVAFANDFFTPSGVPSTGAPLVSATIRNEFANIGTGFDKLPGLAGNGNKVVLVNSGGTALTTAVATALPGMAIGTNIEAWSAQLDALSALGTTGVTVRTGANTFTTRTITGTAAQITVTNGDGVAGAPTISLPSALTFSGFTITGGTYTSPALTTPTLGVATATTINKVTITQPASAATITVPDGTTATFQGTDTYVGRATTDSLTNKTFDATSTVATAAANDNSTKLASTAYVDRMWTTGDVKVTLKTVADTGWVLMNDGTIGDATSGGTTRANADTSALFTLIWNNTTNTDCPVSTGRGGSAAADFAAHKNIALPKALGRALAAFGTGSGLTARTMGQNLGEETHLLSVAEMPAHAHPGSNANTRYDSGGATLLPSGNGNAFGVPGTDGDTAGTTGANIASQGGGGTHNNMQPTVFLNVMVKL